ncbi:MAG TPA: TonB family protein [Rhodoblastus sp.]|nr:TonB family protein [Rhodoblastus sp.]
MIPAAATNGAGRGRVSPAPVAVSIAALDTLETIRAAERRTLIRWSALASVACHLALASALLPAVRDLDAPQMPAGGPAIEMDLAAADAVESTQSIAAPQMDAPVSDATPAAPEPDPAKTVAAEAAPPPPAAAPAAAPPEPTPVTALAVPPPPIPATETPNPDFVAPIKPPVVKRDDEAQAERERLRQARLREQRLARLQEERLERQREERAERLAQERAERIKEEREEKMRVQKARAQREQQEKARAERATQRAAQQAERARAARDSGSGAEAANSRAAARGGAGGAAAGAAQVANWRGMVLAQLQRSKHYPPAARDKNITGQPVITFSLAPSGALSSVSLVRSSGAPILDQAALEMVRRAAPFPPNPAGARGVFSAPVNFYVR